MALIITVSCKKLSYCANCAASLFSSGEVIVHIVRRMSADWKLILQPVHVLKFEDVNVLCELWICLEHDGYLI